MKLLNILRMKQLFLFAFMTVVLFTACVVIGHQAPVMIDRSTNWNPSVFYTDTYNLLIKADDPFFQSFLFDGSNISDENPVYIDLNDDIAAIMECALRAAFGNHYIDNGSAALETKRRTGHTDYYTIELYLGGETCVIIDSTSGRVVQCIDTRIQKQFQLTTPKKLKEGLAYISIDLASLTKEEVVELSQYYSSFSEQYIPRYFVDEKECPLTASKAFEATAKILYKSYPSGRWEFLGDGEYIVYDAPNSNCWLIIGQSFTLLLNKESGKKEFFSVWKDGFSDQSGAC